MKYEGEALLKLSTADKNRLLNIEVEVSSRQPDGYTPI
jgi:hypothetical protein